MLNFNKRHRLIRTYIFVKKNVFGISPEARLRCVVTLNTDRRDNGTSTESSTAVGFTMLR